MFFSDAGWSSLAARRAHNPKVVGSNPTPATKHIRRCAAQVTDARFAIKNPAPCRVFCFCVLQRAAHSTAACACSAVVSNTGSGESCVPISSVISVQPSITACAPRCASPSMIRTYAACDARSAQRFAGRIGDMQEGQRDRALDRVVHAVHRVGREDDQVRAGRFELAGGGGHVRAERRPVVRALQRFDFRKIHRHHHHHALRVVMPAVQCISNAGSASDSIPPTILSSSRRSVRAFSFAWLQLHSLRRVYGPRRTRGGTVCAQRAGTARPRRAARRS